MFDPAGLRENLRELFLAGPNRPHGFVKDYSARRSGALVDGQNISTHFNRPPNQSSSKRCFIHLGL
jgi:hypothetical protein